jgi:hypothetical protein
LVAEEDTVSGRAVRRGRAKWGRYRTRGWIALALAGVACLAVPYGPGPDGVASAAGGPAAGALDTGLAGTGVVSQTGSTSVPVVSDTGVAVAPTTVSADGALGPGSGDIVVAGTNQTQGSSPPPESTIYEYTPAGGLQWATPIPDFAAEALSSVPLASPAPADSGDIVVAGWTDSSTLCTPSTSSVHAPAVVLLDAGGQILHQQALDCAESGAFASVTVDDSGLIVAAGSADSALAGHNPAVVVGRFTTSLAPDSSFGAGGLVETELGGSTATAQGVAVTGSASAEQIFVTGALTSSTPAPPAPYVAGFGAAGAPLAGFGTAGVVTTGYEGSGQSVVVLAGDGPVIVAGEVSGQNGPQNALFEWSSSSGAPATSFGQDGAVINLANISITSQWNALAYQPAGNFLLVGGWARATKELVVSELSAATGALNPAFAQSGSFTQSFGSGSGFANALALAADGSVVAAGAAPTVGNATEGELLELYGTPIGLAAAGPAPTAASTATVTYTVTLGQALSTSAQTALCTFPAPVGSSGNCQTVTFPIGVTSVSIPVNVPLTTPGGDAETVSAYTVNDAGVGATPTTPAPPVLIGHLPGVSFNGYWEVARDGGVFTEGAPGFFGSAAPYRPAAPIVGMAAAPDGQGYWLVGSDGGVFTFGPGAGFYGSAVPYHPAAPIVGMAAAPDGQGYWLVGSDGGVFSFGPGAGFYGSAAPYHPAAPIVGMAPTPDGRGYWLVGADGGVFSFGDAQFYGSAVPFHPAAPMAGMAAAPGGGGYWLVGADGGVFSFGPGAGFYGSAVPYRPAAPMVGMAASPNGTGYWLVGSDGGIFTFGPGTGFFGSAAFYRPVEPVTGMAG